jgi:hypothetical protein
MTFLHFGNAALRAVLIVTAGLLALPVLAQPVAGAAAPAAALPSAELFYQRPAIERTVLSPSGRWLAMASRGGGNRTVLVVFDLQAWKPLAVAARFADADVDAFYWVNDERLVFDITDRSRGGGD